MAEMSWAIVASAALMPLVNLSTQPNSTRVKKRLLCCVCSGITAQVLNEEKLGIGEVFASKI